MRTVARLKIRAVRPPTPAPDPASRYPVINGVGIDWSDLEIIATTTDGEEVALVNVTGINWRASQGTVPPSCTIEFCDVEIDAELEAYRAFSVDVGGNARRPAGVDDEETSS